MIISRRWKGFARLLVPLIAMVVAVPAYAAEEPPYESDPTLSLLGNCETIAGVDPIPDPSCPYPPPPAGPTLSNCNETQCTSRFAQPRAVVLDNYGNEYVFTFAEGSATNGQVDVFDDEGHFLTEATVPAVQTADVDSEGNIYAFTNTGDVLRYEPTAYEFDVIGKEWNIAYGNAPVLVASGAFQGSVAVDAANDQVLIARDTISVYKSAAEGNEFIETYEPLGLTWTEMMAIDSQRRRIFVTFCATGSTNCGVKVLNADNPDEVLETIDGSTVPAGAFAAASGRLPIAVDEGLGDIFIGDPTGKRIYRFGEGYEFLSQLEFSELSQGASQIAISNGAQPAGADQCVYQTNPTPEPDDACNRHDLFVTVFKKSGRVAAFKPSNQGRPVIESVAAGGIGEAEAELKATVDPRGLETEYSFQITTQDAWEANGFNGATVLPGGTISAGSLADEVSVFASGLVAGLTYRFRAVAQNELGPAEEEGQNEATFATYDDPSIASGCSNGALRLGPSALLPDCRAYELVTPADTSGRPPKGLFEQSSVFSTPQVSPVGDAVSSRIEGGSLPGGSGTGGFNGGDPYLAKRSGTGWNSELSGPTGAETTKSVPGGFSSDQKYTFWSTIGEGPLQPVPPNFYAEYLRYPDGHSELIGRGSEGTDPVARGLWITEAGTHVIFTTKNQASTLPVKLEPNAPPSGTAAIYDRTIDPVTGEEETHVVSLLPDDVTPNAGETAEYQGASADGEGVAFGIGKKLYLRVGNETTYEIGENVEFAGVSEGGARIFYVGGGNLKALDTTGGNPEGEVIDFSSTGDVTPVNVSTDGTRAYFVSPTALGGANPEGDSAQEGEENLYLSEEGAISFVATVTERDVNGAPSVIDDGLGLWTQAVGSQPAIDPSRLNPDGSVFLFQSRAEITGYPASEFPQIYRYDAGGEKLQCVSCIPTKTPADGGARLESYSSDAFIGRPFSAYGFVPNLTPDGKRVFFESAEALVSRDTDGVNDVYEWEEQGVGSCKEAEGCVYLISSGRSKVDNFLYGHSTDGRDVFFTTGDRLTGWDSAGGAISIYDARMNGGYPEPSEAKVCAGEGCQPMALSPAPQFPGATTHPSGQSGNLPKSKPCPKGKHKVKKDGKARCVKNKKKKHKSQRGKAKSRAGANGGAGK